MLNNVIATKTANNSPGAPLSSATKTKSTDNAIARCHGTANEIPNRDLSILKAKGVSIARVSLPDSLSALALIFAIFELSS